MNLNDYPLDAMEPAQRPLSAPACEAAVLSILISFSNTLDIIGDRLHADCFTVAENKLMYSTAVAQIASGRGCDVVSVMQGG